MTRSERSPTKCGVSECGREALPLKELSSHGKNNIIFYFSFEALIDKVNIKLNNSKSCPFI
jgi:hypothetical protein